MVTCFRVGTDRPTERLNLHVSSISPLPKSYRDVFSDPNWQNAMRDEYHALIKNKTWTLVPRPPDTNIVCFRGVDVDETFSLVVKPGTIQTVLSLATSRHWPIHQLDVKNEFLHGDLSEIVYMHQPHGFRYSVHPDYGTDTAYLLLYVDDIVLTASSDILVFLSQKKNAIKILEKALIVICNLQVCLYMHDLREPHFNALKWILRYIHGTLAYGLQLFSSSSTDLVSYSDTDWAGCPTTRRSTLGYCVFLGQQLTLLVLNLRAKT
ncbi:ribonuclease H-like domain-containing protein [Tanacetum coccineum]|uniref:Ribonuclease H-like domain-containing protein n=1 Tax=Tanacetum coccineum TaxID=301880 RepID=A0ABQ5DZ52_9ASTR